MPRTITTGDISAIGLQQSDLLGETIVSICVRGEWIELIKFDSGRVASMKQADYADMQKAYDAQSKAPFEPPEF